MIQDCENTPYKDIPHQVLRPEALTHGHPTAINHGGDMSAALAANLQSLPPPLELRDADLVIGKIDGDVVRFRGFHSQRGAAQAAAVAHQAMLRRLARGSRGMPSATESGSAVHRTNDNPKAPANGRPVASVLRNVVDGAADTGDFAFEIRVPPPIDELRMRGLAYVMYRALRSSGVAWPLLRPATDPDGPALAAQAAATGVSGPQRERAARGLHGIQRFLDRASRAWAFPWTRPQRAG